MNIVYLVHRTWSLDILLGLVDAQKNKNWKVGLVFSPLGEFGPLPISCAKHNEIDPLKLENHIEEIKSAEPTVIITFGWSWIIPKSILDIAPCLVLHPSPLPKGRGGSPIQNQLLEGIKESAVTIISAAEEIDSGDIFAQEPISFEGYLDDIFMRIADTGLKLTIPLMDQFSQGNAKGTTQDHSLATHYVRRKPEMSEITISEIQTQPAEYLYNKVRGLQEPYPKAFIVCADGKKLYISTANLEEN